MTWRNWPVPGGWRICLQAETMLTPVYACVVAWQNLRLNSSDGVRAFCKGAKPGRIMNTDSRKLDSQPRRTPIGTSIVQRSEQPNVVCCSVAPQTPDRPE